MPKPRLYYTDGEGNVTEVTAVSKTYGQDGVMVCEVGTGATFTCLVEQLTCDRGPVELARALRVVNAEMNVTFERTRDAAAMRAVFSIYAPTLEEERGPDIYEQLLTTWEGVLWRADGRIAGAALLRPFGQRAVECHFTLLPWTWGNSSLAIARAFFAWVWHTSPCARICGEVDTDNRLALRFLRQLGFRVCGARANALEKRRRLLDVFVLEIFRS